jgi:hypothetical protein
MNRFHGEIPCSLGSYRAESDAASLIAFPVVYVETRALKSLRFFYRR